MQKDLKTVVIAVAVSGAMSVSVAGAATLITGANVKNGSLTGLDIKDGSIATRDLAKSARPKDGSNGTNGSNGVNGTGGAKGDKGDTGAQGQNGDTGATGAQGQKGDTGATGATGPQGPQGGQGVPGEPGTPGATGPQGPAGPAGLPGDFGFTNNTLKLTGQGVEFGPYADGGCQVSGCGGSLYYGGLNGKTLADLTDLVYRAKYSTSDNITNAVPYLRIFTEGDTHDVIFSPNTQDTPDVAEDVFHTWDALGGTVRYDNDSGGAGPDPTWADTVTAHGTDVISGIYITTGFSAGTDLSAVVRQFTANGKAFTFGS